MLILLILDTLALFLLHLDYRKRVISLYFLGCKPISASRGIGTSGIGLRLHFGVKVTTRRISNSTSRYLTRDRSTYVLRACGRPFLFSSTSA